MKLPSSRYYTFTLTLELDGGMHVQDGLEFNRTMNALTGYAVEAFEDSLPGHIFDYRGGCKAAYITKEKPKNWPAFPPPMDVMP